MLNFKKALPIWGAFFVACSSLTYASCPLSNQGEQVSIAHIYDGDTVKLSDGRRVRLIGLNTPETAKPDRSGEPLADEAKVALAQFLDGKPVFLRLGQQQRDHYKRWLGDLYTDQRPVAEALLEQGLAYYIAIPPNLRLVECYRAAESRAQKAKRGLWAVSPWRDIRSLKNRESGFRLLYGRLDAVKQIRKGVLLELNDKLAVKLNPETSRSLGGLAGLKVLKGQQVYLRGWIKPKARNAPSHYQPWFMELAHKTHFGR